MMPTDQGKLVILTLLDLSDAFDTVGHDVFFYRLKDKVGLSGKVLDLFRSYLEQRSQGVSVHGVSVLGLWFSQCICILLGE